MRSKQVTIAALVAVSILTGCSTGPSPQVEAMNDVLDELKQEKLSEVVCEFTYDRSGILFMNGNPYSRSVAIEGNHVEAAIGLLEDQGFVSREMSSAAKASFFTRPDGMRAAVVNSGPESAGTVIPYDRGDTCTVPEGGMTTVDLTMDP